MSALGQKQTLPRIYVMSALPPKADIDWRLFDVCFVPKADMTAHHCSGLNQQLSEHQKGQKARQSIIKATFLSARQAKSGRAKE
jgi:hypothetical protein